MPESQLVVIPGRRNGTPLRRFLVDPSTGHMLDTVRTARLTTARQVRRPEGRAAGYMFIGFRVTRA